jgi:trehalose synthase
MNQFDLTKPNKDLWNYLVPTIEKYDAVILSLKDYAKKLRTPQVFLMPAIDPF